MGVEKNLKNLIYWKYQCFVRGLAPLVRHRPRRQSRRGRYVRSTNKFLISDLGPGGFLSLVRSFGAFGFGRRGRGHSEASGTGARTCWGKQIARRGRRCISGLHWGAEKKGPRRLAGRTAMQHNVRIFKKMLPVYGACERFGLSLRSPVLQTAGEKVPIKKLIVNKLTRTAQPEAGPELKFRSRGREMGPRIPCEEVQCGPLVRSPKLESLTKRTL